MSFEEHKNKFDILKLRWCLNEVEREIDEDFPFLKMFKNPYTSIMIEFFGNLDKDEQRVMGRAITKVRSQNILKLMNQSVTSQEEEMSNYFYENLRGIKNIEKVFEFRRNIHQDIIKVKNFKKLIQNKIDPFLGKPIKIPRSNQLLYEFRYDDRWDIKTLIEPWNGGIQYSQRISEAGSKLNRLTPILGFNVLSWFGIPDQFATWENLNEQGAAEAIDSLWLMCNRFFDALPQLLEPLKSDE
jgi:hypothetical protein